MQRTYCQSQAACRCGLAAFLDGTGEWRPVPQPPDSALGWRQRVTKESPKQLPCCVSRLRIRDLLGRQPAQVCQPAIRTGRPLGGAPVWV